MNEIAILLDLHDELIFFSDVFGIRENNFKNLGRLPTPSSITPSPGMARMTGVMNLSNQPEFESDAPWWLEPNHESFTLVFYVGMQTQYLQQTEHGHLIY